MQRIIIAVLMLIIVVLGSLLVFETGSNQTRVDDPQAHSAGQASNQPADTQTHTMPDLKATLWPAESELFKTEKVPVTALDPANPLQRSPLPGIFNDEVDDDSGIGSLLIDDGRPITSKPWADFNLKLSIPTTWLAYADEHLALGSVAGWYLPNRAEAHLYLVPKAHHNLNPHQQHGLVSYLSEAELSGPDWEHHEFFSVRGAWSDSRRWI